MHTGQGAEQKLMREAGEGPINGYPTATSKQLPLATNRSNQGAPIELIGLSKFYGSIAAVRDINLSIGPGEFMTFLGPSGSGKTTVLSCLAGFTIPSAGDLRIGGRSVVMVPPHKRNIGLVFQNYALFPHLDVSANVAFPLEMRGLPKDEIRRRVAETLQLVRLTGLESRRPRQLSGGQQQRVALARALVFNPPVLLLDEPLGALDAKLREQMKIELKDLHRTIGSTILFVTHDQEEALTLSDRIAVFNGGQIAQVGRPDELYREPATRFVADFIGETNLLSGPIIGVSEQSLKIGIADGLEAVGYAREGFPLPVRRATFALRPENVALGAEATAMANRYRGRLEQSLYVGSSTKHVIRLSPSLVVTARQPVHARFETLIIGSEIVVGWRECDLLLVDVDTADT